MNRVIANFHIVEGYVADVDERHADIGCRIIGEDEFGASFYGLAFDEINNLIYTGTTDYFSFGEVKPVVVSGSIQLTRTLTPADATINSEVWSTEAGQITQEGLFTPAGVGQALVTLTINGIAKTLEVEVVAAPVTEDPAQ